MLASPEDWQRDMMESLSEAAVQPDEAARPAVTLGDVIVGFR